MDLKTNKVQEHQQTEPESTDETDYVQTSKKDKEKCYNPLKKGFLQKQSTKKTSVYGDCELQTTVKSHLEKFHLFHFPLRKKSDPLISSEKLQQLQQSKEQKPRLIKSSSIARLFGNNYSTKKSEESKTMPQFKKSHSNLEKFYDKSKECDNECEKVEVIGTNHNSIGSDAASDTTSIHSSSFQEKHNLKAIRTLTRGLGKLLRRNCDSVDISLPDPEYKVYYLGNVLTGWAKGECFLNFLCAKYCRFYQSDI